METFIAQFHQKLYFSAIQNLAFNFTNVHILGVHNFVKIFIKAFQSKGFYQYVKCFCGYSECFVASFSHQIKSGSRYLSMGVLLLNHYCDQQHIVRTYVHTNTTSTFYFGSFL